MKRARSYTRGLARSRVLCRLNAHLPPVLETRALACERDGDTLFSPVDLTVVPGDVVEVLGVNGAGKSTLLRTLAGMTPDYLGEVLFRGVDLRAGSTALSAELLYVGHRTGLNAQLAPEQNLAWYERIGGGGGASGAGIERALRSVGLTGYLGVPCGRLSAGQQRRVALARLLLTRASLWLLDEPGTALDSDGVALLERLLVAHRARGGASVIATHAQLASATQALRLRSVATA